MAEARVSVNVEQFKCCVCLDLMKDPVTTTCGHSFCGTCIKNKWDQDHQMGAYSCPVCRKNFRQRPDLSRNTMLGEMVDILRQTQVGETSLTGPGDVECDVCIGRKNKAVKSCLVCLASYCTVHFTLHNELHPGNDHEITEAKHRLKDMICVSHNKLKELYCRNEQECVCALCALNVHRAHQLVQIKIERSTQQDQVCVTKEKISKAIHQRENALLELQLAVDSLTASSQSTILYTESIFDNMTKFLQAKESLLKNQIKVKVNSGLRYAEGIRKQLEMETATLKKRATDLDQLGSSKNDIYFLQTLPSLTSSPMYEPLPKITFTLSTFENTNKSLFSLGTNMNAFCTTEVAKMTKMVTNMKMIETSVALSRGDFLKYFHQPTVEPNSISPNLILEKNCKLIWSNELQKYPKHPERYGYLAQALCKTGLSECHYWEMEWHGPQVYVGVSYKGVIRKGCGSSLGFGHNNQSWSLCCSHTRSYFCHNIKETEVLGPVSSRIGVYLDYRAGILSFYSVSNLMTLLHSVKTKFTEPLYPGFWVFDGSNVRICQYEEIVPPETDTNDDARPVSCLGISQFYIWHY